MTRLAVAVLCLSASVFAQAAPTYQTVVLSEGNVKFALQPADKEQYEQDCPLNVCTCESDISYIRLRAPTTAAAIARINLKLKSEASQVQCSYLEAEASMKQEVTYLSARLVSVMEQSYQQEIATGGSCHGGSAVHTFDLTTGKEYVLRDAISSSSLAQLRSSMPASIVNQRNRHEHDTAPTESREDYAQDLKSAREGVANVADKQLLSSSIFIQKGRLFINVEGYLFGCVGGTFHPAEIPASLVTLPSIRQELLGK